MERHSAVLIIVRILGPDQDLILLPIDVSILNAKHRSPLWTGYLRVQWRDHSHAS